MANTVAIVEQGLNHHNEMMMRAMRNALQRLERDGKGNYDPATVRVSVYMKLHRNEQEGTSTYAATATGTAKLYFSDTVVE